VRGSEELIGSLRQWLDDSASRLAAGAAGLDVVHQYAGATTRTVALIEATMEHPRAPALQR
jgi:hypothetical protein